MRAAEIYQDVHVHQHGPTWWQVIILAGLTLAAYDLLRWAGDELYDLAIDARDRWRRWRDEHGSTAVEDAADDRPECGCGHMEYCPDCAPVADSHSPTCTRPINHVGPCWSHEAAARVAERSET